MKEFLHYIKALLIAIIVLWGTFDFIGSISMLGHNDETYQARHIRD